MIPTTRVDFSGGWCYVGAVETVTAKKESHP